MDIWCVLWQLCEVIVVLVLLAVLDIRRRGYSTAISWPRLLFLYCMRHLSSIKGYMMLRKFEREVRQFQEVQSEFLMARIRRCEDTAYGRDHHFASIRSVEDFRRSHPVVDFSHVEEYVDRMASGDKSALLGKEDDIHMFITTSGTTGRNKRIPLSAQGANDMQKHLVHGPCLYVMRRDTGSWNVQRMTNIANGRTVEHTASGHNIGVVSNVVYSESNRFLASLYTSPLVSLEVKGEFESQYIHMLFALRDKHISAIITFFIHNFLSMMRRMESFQQDLVNDVRRGRIKEDLNISDSIRAQLNACLEPMPERADEIRGVFAGGFRCIISRLWPDVTRISGIWSGSTNEIYYREAKEIVGPDIMIISIVYTSSESVLGGNMDTKRPGAPRYALLPDTTFFEFLPIYKDRILDLEDICPQDLLLATELEVGKEYEMIITNASGLYRYRLGDVIRVESFYQQAPEVEFLYRSGQALNVNGEKLSEEVFFRALRKASQRWSATLKDYTVAGSQFAPASRGALDPHYILFVEAEGGQLAEDDLGLVDTILREEDDEYASFRKLGKIAKMSARQVPTGTFSRFRQHLVGTTRAASGQFKMPRVLKTCDMVQWFLDNL